MSNKYERPSGAYMGATGLSNRTKYQTDAAEVPKVAISSAKIDGDINYLVDALNEIDDASGTRASVNDRLDVSLNADGTLKVSVASAINQWVDDTGISALARVSDTSITINGDQTGVYTSGRRVRLTVNGAFVYASVLESTYSGGLTTLELGDVVDANGGIVAISANPAIISYSMMSVGLTGNMPSNLAALKMRDFSPILRLKDVDGSEFGLRSDAGQLDFVENIGTEDVPVWIARGSVSSTGIELANYSLSINKIATGTAGEMIAWDSSNNPISIAAGTSGQVMTSNGAAAPSFQTLSGIPSGVTMPFAGATAPSGFLLCYGQAVSRTTYADLFAAISTVHGAGDGSTTFNVPDMRGRAVFGKDDMGGTAASRVTSGGSGLVGSTLGASGGDELMHQHNHGIADPGHTHQFTSTSPGSPYVGGYQYATVVNGQNTSSSTTGITINNAGTGASENIPPAIVMNYIIKT